VLEQAHQFCDDAYPMHKLAAHPDAARLFGLFNDNSTSAKDGRPTETRWCGRGPSFRFADADGG
jgi:hypothetical protein